MSSRSGSRGLSLSQDGSHSPLYSAPRRNFNPSSQGSHIQEEIADVTKWANQYLSLAGFSDQLVTDLAADMADGITLLRLVQAVVGEPLPRHFPSPIMRVQKLENLTQCLQYLTGKGLSLRGVHPDEIAAGNVKSILAVCLALKRHYTGRVSPKSSNSQRRSPSNSLSFSTLNREDMALLSWLGGVTRKTLSHYSSLHDGYVLCDFMNEVHEGAVTSESMTRGGAAERLRLAFSAGERFLYISPGKLNAVQVSRGGQDGLLKAYLQQCQQVYQHREEQRRQKAPSEGRKSGQRHSREEAFESLRTSSGSVQSREAALVSARTFEGLRQQKAGTGTTSQEHTSSGTRQPRPPSGTRQPHPSSGTSQPHSSRRPLSEIYVSGASSYSDLSTTRQDHRAMVGATPLTKHPSTEGLRQAPPPPPPSSLHKKGASLGRSLDSGIARPSAPSPHFGSSWSGSQSGYDSDTASSTASTQLWSQPRRSLSQSNTSIPPPPPSIPPPSKLHKKSLTRSAEVVSQPTFDPFGPRPPPRRSSSYQRLDSGTMDELGSQVADLHERVGTLTMQFIYEKADTFKQLQRALVKERKKRVAIETRLRHVERTAQQMCLHYDGCLVQLAREVSRLQAHFSSGSAGELDQQEPSSEVVWEMESLKRQVATLSQQVEASSLTPTASQTSLSAGPSHRPKGTTKQPLFIRKRASSDSVVTPHGPFSRGSSASYKKLKNFFGEEPPRLEDLNSFLEGLNYSYLLQIFTSHQITLAELRYMDNSHLERLGVPLGPRVRILSELKKLEPLSTVSDVI